MNSTLCVFEYSCISCVAIIVYFSPLILVSTCSFSVIWYSRSGRLEIAKCLVNEGHCDPNARDNDGKTPLHYACM